MVFEVVGIDDFGWCHVQVCVTFSIFLMDLLVSRNYRKEISGFILMGDFSIERKKSYFDNSFVPPLAPSQHNEI